MRRVAAILALAIVYAAPARAQSLPSRLSDDDFWRLVNDLSEPGGYFRSDNFVSNETTFQHVIPELVKSHPSGGVYLGVGPDQNFSYIVALRPRLSIVTDIRRQNMIEHLMYKAVIELAPTRADFLALLFSRPRPAGIADTTGAPALLQAYVAAPSDSIAYRKNLAAIREQLVNRHKFTLTADDLSSLAYVYEAFFEGGPELTYSFSVGRQGRAGYFGRRMPTYAELMAEADALGTHRSYLASEENYRGTYKHAGVDDKPVYPRAEHPIIRTHPVTGKKALYVNRGFTRRIVGVSRDESDGILRYLYDHAENELWQCRFRWRANSIAFWDNRCVQHRAMGDY